MNSSAVKTEGFGVEIIFSDSSDPAKIFAAAGKLISACQNFQAEISHGIYAVDIEPFLVVEDVSNGSILIWLKQRINDFKKSLVDFDSGGFFSYLTQSNKALLVFSQHEEITGERLVEAQKKIFEIASATNPTPNFPNYGKIPK